MSDEDEDGLAWANETADRIISKGYANMGVTYSPGGEYGDSVDILMPQTFSIKLEPSMVWTGDSTGRLAKSLIPLYNQANEKWPNRSRANDGTIGDDAHKADPTSDHNKDDEGVVRALDITLDLVEGEKLAEALRLSRDPRISYVIHNGRIFNSVVSPWIWRNRNKGPGDHTEHVHISVVKDDALADDTRAWNIGKLAEPVDEGTDPMPPPSPDVDAAMARLNDVVAELRAQEARISALEKKPMPDTQPQPQIDWAAVLQPVIKALLPELPKLLPLLMPLALQLITQWLAPKQPQGIAAVSGGTWATIAGAIATAVLGYGQARGVVPAEATLAAGGATLAAGGYAVKK